ncbi:MAG TPA: YebC/PmpR family DNA-binding transcriptional regulator [Pirellulaceae bacterium]|jgi:YebC/PmpR family DNA-binding regulatory protein|nr:YebC/PmpR family DNA-binding transcriptional regulator [Pirellulaceae bacterium]
MAGHSHWANISRKKSLVDQKRAKVWTKLSRAIIVAARLGGPDPDANFRLRKAVLDARAVSMPADNIDRAIKKGAGGGEGGNVDELTYEGYGPAGVAVMLDIMTDNRNRTASEVRKIFDIHGGKLGESGCVGWMFQRKGVFIVPANSLDADRLMEIALEAGAEDVSQEDDNFEVVCAPDAFTEVSDALEAAKVEILDKQVTRISENYADVGVEDAKRIMKLMDALDDQDDVQAVTSNMNLTPALLAEIEKA